MYTLYFASQISKDSADFTANAIQMDGTLEELELKGIVNHLNLIARAKYPNDETAYKHELETLINKYVSNNMNVKLDVGPLSKLRSLGVSLLAIPLFNHRNNLNELDPKSQSDFLDRGLIEIQENQINLTQEGRIFLEMIENGDERLLKWDRAVYEAEGGV
jgi:hypothetical protein